MEEQKTMAMTPEMCAAECQQERRQTIYKLIKNESATAYPAWGRNLFDFHESNLKNWLAGQSN